MRRKKVLLTQITTLLIVMSTVGALTVWASGFSTGKLVQVSGSSPFSPGCNGAPQSGQNFLNSEVEPWVDFNPVDPKNIVGAWQQDRWSTGGANSLVAGVTHNGGNKWQTVVIPKITRCAGGNEYERATDPWLSFAPNGHLYLISLSFNDSNTTNALLVSKSTNGGDSWSDPITIIRDTDPRFFNDKQSITADPTDSNFVYAVWDRLEDPQGFINNPDRAVALGFHGPAMFSRTTNAGQSWEPARKIYDPGGINQTIGNQIVVLPDGTVIDFFSEILNFRNDNSPPQFDASLSLLRSSNKGQSWLPNGRPIRASQMLPRSVFTPPPNFISVYNPDDINVPIRTADILFDVAVDPNNGKLYAVWQDSRFSNNGNFSDPNAIIDEVAFSMSTDGGSTWTAPVKINKTPGGLSLANRQAFLPSVHVSADGTVLVTYYDFRNNDGNPGAPTDHWAIHCHTGCDNPDNWGNEIRLTNASFDILQAPFANGFFLGDYVGLDSTGNDFGAFFTQAKNSSDPTNIFFRRIGP